MLTTFRHSDFALTALLDALDETAEAVTVCVPARNSGELAGRTVAALMPLREAGLIGQILVIDGSSGPETALAARSAGAEVIAEGDLLPELGQVRGKGDAMWRALSASRGDLICFIDSDLSDFGPHYVTGLLGPLLLEGREFSKATYSRPLRIGDEEFPGEGGRVTELTARPLLERLFPRVASFRQPLAGEVAARRELFEAIPFRTGYGVEVAMLIDLVDRIGLERMAEVDLGTRRNSHQSLPALAAMAREVVAAVFSRLDDEALGADAERPPMAGAGDLPPPGRGVAGQEAGSAP